jgi:hypothetical protein
MNKMSSKPRYALTYLVVAVLAFVVFLPWIQGYFVGDDWMLLTRNSGRALPDQLGSISDVSNSRLYRPLSELSLAWSWSLFGLNPVGHHAVNFALHALNTVLVALLGQCLAHDRRVGLLAGLSFAVLSCHTEAVMWITARHEMLATMLALLSTISYIRFRDSDRRMWWVGAFLFYVASLGFKETTWALPLLLIFYDLIFTFPSPKGGRLWQLRAGQLIPLLPPVAVGIVYLLFRLQVGGGYNVPFNVVALFKNLIYYLLMEIVALPVSTRFLSRFPLLTLPVIVSLTMACVLSVWLARDRIVRDRVAWFGVLWMVFALAPVSLIVTERTTHFSSVGWTWVIAATLVLAWDATAQSRFSPKRGLVVLAVVAVLGANLATLVQRSYWWNRSANISRDVLGQVQVSLLNLPPGKDSQLWFFNLPNQMEYAYSTVGSRILFAVWWLQDQAGTDAQVLVFQGEINESPSEHMKQLLSERAIEDSVVAFYWQEGTVVVESNMAGGIFP